MANLTLENGATRPLHPLVALFPGILLILTILSPWFTFGALLFGLVFLGECIGRLDRGSKWHK